MAEEQMRLLQETADRVQRETGFHVCFRDYGTGVTMTVGNTGTSDWSADHLRMFLEGFASGVASEQGRNGDNG